MLEMHNALANACEYDIDSDVVSLARAARIVRKGMFQAHQAFSGSFSDNCQEDSVPQLLVSMILEGPSIEEQSSKSSAFARMTIAQLLKYNSVKHATKEA